METVDIKTPQTATEVVDVTKVTPKRSPAETERRVLTTAESLNMDIDEVTRYYDLGVESAAETEVNKRIESNKTGIITTSIEDARVKEEDPVKALVDLHDELNKVEFIRGYLDPGTVAMITGTDKASRDFAIKKLTKLAVATDTITKKVQTAVPDFWSLAMAGDFLDLAASSVPGYSWYVAEQNEAFTKRFEELIASDIPVEQMQKELEVALTEAEDAGLFTESNGLFLMDLVDTVGYGTESYSARMVKAGAAVDILFGAAGAADTIKGATKAVKVSGELTRLATSGNKRILKDAADAMAHAKMPTERITSVLDRTVIMDDPSRAGVKIPNHTSPSVATPLSQRKTYWNAPTRAAARVWEETSTANIIYRSFLRSAGKAIDQEVLDVVKNKVVTEAREAAKESRNARYLDSDLAVDDRQNLIQQDFIGTAKGVPFTGEAGKRAAIKTAEKLGSGYEVRPYVNPDEWAIVRESNVPIDVRGLTMDTLAHYTATPIEELRSGAIIKYLGSPAAQTSTRLDAILKLEEAASEVFRKDISAYLKEAYKGMSDKDIGEVYKLEDIIGDNPKITTALTEAEFKNAFFDEFKKQPSERQVLAYLVKRDIGDMQAMKSADRRFKELVGRKAVVLDDTTIVVPTNKESLKAGAKIYDADTETLVDASKIPEEQVIYANEFPLDGSLKGGALYVTKKQPDVRRIYHSDVMQYNAGNSRVYMRNQNQHFVKQAREVEASDGTIVKVAPLTIMATRTEKEALKAVGEINNIITHIKSVVGKSVKKAGDVSAAVGALKPDAKKALEKVIQENNGWFGPEMNSVEKLLEWAKDNHVDLGVTFDRVSEGRRIYDDGEVWGVSPSETYGDAFMANSFKNFSRKDKALTGYGQTEIPRMDSRKAFERSLLQTVGHKAEGAYMIAATNGLLKSAMEHKVLGNIKELRGLTLRQKLMKADIDTGTLAGKRLELERQKILGRASGTNFITSAWQNAMLHVGNFLYEKGKKKLAMAADKWSNDPLTALRGYTFDAKLGMFNFDQLWVQSIGASINVMAIGGLAGVKGTALYSPVRFALINGNEAVIRKVGNLVEPMSGLTEDQFVKMVKWFQESGRSTVGHALSEFGEDASQASIGLAKLREKGRFFFNEGELIGRIAANNTAFIEFFTKFGKDADPFLEVNRRWLMKRQDTLTTSMTAASKTPLEHLPFAQFFSYTFRINEALFSGTFNSGKKILTNAEKLRLATVHSVMFGASGWTGLNFAADRLEHLYGKPVDGPTYDLFRKGLMDAILSYSTGIETDVSSRLGAGEGVFQMISDMYETNALDFFFGASGNVGASALTSILGLAKDMVTLNTELAKEDLLLLLTEIKTVNTAYNAYIGFSFHEARNKKNAELFEVTDMEVILRSLGVPLEKETDMYRYIQQTKIDKSFIEGYTLKAQKLLNNYEAAYRAEDWEEARRWSAMLSTALNSLDPLTAKKVRDALRTGAGPMLDSLTLQATKNNTNLLGSE